RRRAATGMSAPGVGFRPIPAADFEFLYRVYASTRTEALAGLDWPAAAKGEVLRAEVGRHHPACQGRFAEAGLRIGRPGEHAIRRVYLARGEHEIHVVDIALLPENRNAGLGTAILTDILAEAARGAKRVSIHVEMFNPAQRLYQRLGFRRTGEEGVYYRME